MFRYILIALAVLALILFFKAIIAIVFVVSFLVWINIGLNPLMQLFAVLGFIKGKAAK